MAKKRLTEKRLSGTREWAENSANGIFGCSHGCLYCYARTDAMRFGKIKHAAGADWMNEVRQPSPLVRKPKQVEGRIMYPTRHDVTMENIGYVLEDLEALLAAGNKILLVSKPHKACVQEICREFAGRQDQLAFRFTIGALHNATLAFWEPHAPPFEERMKALALAYREGWSTSVSCEPLLEPWSVDLLVARLKPYVKDSIWIGSANRLRQRTAWCRRAHALRQTDLEKMIRQLEAWQTPEVMTLIHGVFAHDPLIKWKDSYRKALNLTPAQGAE